MARKASSSTSPLWLIVALVVAFAFAAGGYTIYSQLNDPFRTIAPLPTDDYLRNANSLRGNRYRIEAVVANQLAWSADAGRLYSMDLEVSGEVLPVLIPVEFNAINLQKGQRFTVEVEVLDRGILQARQLRKA